MQLKFIDHLVLIVKNIEETEKFYTRVLGKPEHISEDSVSYKIGKTKIFFSLAYGEYEKSDKDKSGLNHLAFGVKTGEELRKFERILNEVNIKNSGIKIDKYGNNEFIWFDDPNNIRLEIYCRPE